MKHLLSIEQTSREEIDRILRRTAEFKTNRGRISSRPLAGQTWALIFSKPSTRTRVSFEVGIRELGGESIYMTAADAQLGRGELIKDTARVLARMTHGAIIRTYSQRDIEEFAEFSGVPTVNALTDDEHPCQILGDIFTIQEKRGRIEDKVITFVGSFTDIRGEYVYPELVAASEKKPLRIFLQDGRNDNRNSANPKNDWFYQNVRLAEALTKKGYDVNYTWGMNNHGQKFGGAILPEMMRWLWRDGPVSTDPNDKVERGFNPPAARKN